MGYKAEIVKIAVQVAEKIGIRAAARLIGIGREAIGRWIERLRNGLPTHLKTTPRQVRNRTGQNVLNRIHKLLEANAGTIETWAKTGKKVCIRTVQRWKTKWFPPLKEKVKSKRYEHRKLFSMAHTDWGTKRINEGKRCCFTFSIRSSHEMSRQPCFSPAGSCKKSRTWCGASSTTATRYHGMKHD